MLKVQEIRELIKLIDQSDINEFTYETDGNTITMKKNGGSQAVVKEVVAPVSETTQRAVEVKTEPVVENKVVEETKVNKTETNKSEVTAPQQVDYDHEIVSPMVGTFYAAPSPESDPYVSVGSKVQNDTVVCIVEAMKLFNEIEAEATGEIVEILAEDGELVEYGQPLFRVKTK